MATTTSKTLSLLPTLTSKPLPAAPRPRRWALYTASSAIFGHSPNPTSARRGSRILRAPLIGPKIAAYYPPRVSTAKEFNKFIQPMNLETYDDEDVLKEERLRRRKARGKGAPRKRRTKEESKRAKGKGKKKAAAPAKLSPSAAAKGAFG